MTSKQKKVTFIVGLVLAYVAYMVYCEITSNIIEKQGKYTVGVVSDFRMNFRNGYTVYYEYTISGIRYEENLLVSQDYNDIVRHRFFVKFNPKQPNQSLILLDKPVLSKYWDAPSDGWDKIPE